MTPAYRVYWLAQPHCAQARAVAANPQTRPCAAAAPGAFRNNRGGWSQYVPGTDRVFVCRHEP